MKKRLYFAHSRKDYGSEREKIMLKKIKHIFNGCEVTNPGEPAFVERMTAMAGEYISANKHISPWLKYINGCDVLVFMPLATGKTGVGTYLEVRHAEAMQIPIYVWNGTVFTMRYSIIECHTRSGGIDYDDNWSEVIL